MGRVNTSSAYAHSQSRKSLSRRSPPVRISRSTGGPRARAQRHRGRVRAGPARRPGWRRARSSPPRCAASRRVPAAVAASARAIARHSAASSRSRRPITSRRTPLRHAARGLLFQVRRQQAHQRVHLRAAGAANCRRRRRTASGCRCRHPAPPPPPAAPPPRRRDGPASRGKPRASAHGRCHP